MDKALEQLVFVLRGFFYQDGWTAIYGGRTKECTNDITWAESGNDGGITIYVSTISWKSEPPHKPTLTPLLTVTMTDNAKILEINRTLHEVHKDGLRTLFERLEFTVKAVGFPEA